MCRIIGLYGIGGLYNYGCEAIVRGTTAILREANPDCKIVYFTPRKSEDEKIISDLNIEVEQISYKKLSVAERAINKMCRKLKVPYQSLAVNYEQIFNKCDVIVSIGGDIYTIPKHIREQKTYNFYNQLIDIGTRAKQNNKYLIIFGASIGPFGNYNRAIKYYVDNLKKVNLILARECACVDYLNSIGLKDNVSFMVDPAFFVKANVPQKEKKYFGVNLSALSISEMNGIVAESALKKQAELIEKIIEKTGLEAMLIPHVFSHNDLDNDYVHLKNVYEHIDEKYKKMIKLVKPDSFMDVKNYVAECKFVIAARMHCAVNSLCEGVPAIFLSYSSKSIGMAEVVYGNREWVLPLDIDNEEIVIKAIQINEQCNDLSKQIIENINLEKEKFESRDSFAKLKQIIK